MRKWKIYSAILPLMALPAFGHTAAFQVFEQSANSLGYAHADMAALADDASTVFFNPAGMTRFCRPQAVGGLTFADVRMQFEGYVQQYNANASSPLQTVLVPAYIYSQSIGALLGEALIWSSQNIGTTLADPILSPQNFRVPKSKGDTHPLAPYLHFLTPLYCSKDFTLSGGISVAAPFGLESDYTGTYVQSTTSDNKFEQISVNPALAARYKKFSLGAGINYMFLKDTYTVSLVNSGSSIYLHNVDPTLRNLDFSSKSRLWTWNIGALYEFSDSFRVGATYRARSDFRQKGDINLLGLTGKATSVFRLPDYLNAGFYLDVTPCVALLFDFGVSFWSRFKQVSIKTDLEPLVLGFADGLFTVADNDFRVPFHFKNSYFAALGTKVRVDEDLALKFGLSYETSPTTDQTRELRIPDYTRYSIAAGIHYQITTHLGLDAAYQYTYVPKTDVKHVPLTNADLQFSKPSEFDNYPNGGGEFNGSVKSSAQLFSMQLSWSF